MCPFDPSPPTERDPQVVDTGGVESEAGASSWRKSANLHREQRRLDDLVFQSSIRLAQSARKAQKVGGTRTTQRFEETIKCGARNLCNTHMLLVPWRALEIIISLSTSYSSYFVCAEHRVIQYIHTYMWFRCP